MSNLDAVRTERRLSDDRHDTPILRRLDLFATIAIVVLAAVIGLTEIHLLPTFSADDFGSILFGSG